MMKQYVFEVIEEAAKQRSRDDKVKVLKSLWDFFSQL